jgi:hypothetical protein
MLIIRSEEGRPGLMSSDDLTQELQGGEEKTTQPTITAVFRLLHEVKLAVENLSSRLDVTNTRLDEVETRLARDLAGVDVRLSDKMENGFAELSDKLRCSKSR